MAGDLGLGARSAASLAADGSEKAQGRIGHRRAVVKPSGFSRLGELEARVMETMWDRAGWLTPREVLELLLPERTLAYTTAMTILVRLWRKGLLERRKDGRAFAYHAVQSREEWTARRMSELLMVAENRAEALSRFVAVMGKADRDQLRRLLRAIR